MLVFMMMRPPALPFPNLSCTSFRNSKRERRGLLLPQRFAFSAGDTPLGPLGSSPPFSRSGFGLSLPDELSQRESHQEIRGREGRWGIYPP